MQCCRECFEVTGTQLPAYKAVWGGNVKLEFQHVRVRENISNYASFLYMVYTISSRLSTQRHGNQGRSVEQLRISAVA